LVLAIVESYMLYSERRVAMMLAASIVGIVAIVPATCPDARFAEVPGICAALGRRWPV